MTGGPSGSQVLLLVGKKGKNLPPAQGNGIKNPQGGLQHLCAEAVPGSPLPFQPACDSLANPTHTARACCSPQLCLRRGLR